MGKGYESKERNYAAETQANLEAQVKMMPDIYAAESEYRPQFAQLDMDIAKSISPQLVDLYREISPDLQELDAASASANRESDIADIERLGFRAREAFLSANPLIAEMEAQAMEELEAGGELTEFDRRRVQQDVRSSQADRGFGYGVNDAAMEAYVQDRAYEDRKAQRRNFAAGVAGMSADPFMSILGRSSGSGAAAAAGAVGQGQGYNPGQLFNPESQYAADLYQSNQQAQAAAGASSAGFAGGIIGGGLSALGSLGGGLLGNAGLFAAKAASGKIG